MAVEITSRITSQRVRLASRVAAERYAEIIGGGLRNWEFAVVPDQAPPPPVEIPEQTRRVVHLALEDWRRRGPAAGPSVSPCGSRAE